MASTSSSSSPDWVKFFTAAGIPSRYAAKYAVTFSEHRIQEDMLKDLNKEILSDMGIRTIGDVIAILRHAKEVDEERSRAQIMSSKNTSNNQQQVRRPAVKRIVSAITESQTGDNSGLTTLSRRFAAVQSGSASVTAPQKSVNPVQKQIVKRIVSEPITESRVIRLQTDVPLSTGSVFDRLDRPVKDRLGGPTSTLTSGSALRGIGLTASTTVPAKATATVRPTRGTPYSIRDRLGGKGSSSGREVIYSNLKLKTDPLTAASPPASQRVQIVSLKKSIFDRLGS